MDILPISAKTMDASFDNKARIEHIRARVLSIYQNDEAAAAAFMSRPHLMLEGKTPLEVILEGDARAGLLNLILGTIEHGFSA